MARATTSAIAERIDILQLMLLEDSSNSACVAHSSQEWGGTAAARLTGCSSGHGSESVRTWMPQTSADASAIP